MRTEANLGLFASNADIRSAVAALGAISALLPHVNAAPYVAASEINLASSVSAVLRVANSISVGPFSYFDARFAVTPDFVRLEGD